jgi:hypothetical protein
MSASWIKSFTLATLLSVAVAGNAYAGVIQHKRIDADKLTQMYLQSSLVICDEDSLCKYAETGELYTNPSNTFLQPGSYIIYPDGVFTKEEIEYYAPEVQAFYNTLSEQMQ